MSARRLYFPSRVPVRLGSRRYDVLIGSGQVDRFLPEVRRLRCGTHPVVLSNPPILEKHGRSIVKALSRGGFPVRTLTVADTERSKSLETLGRLLQGLADLDGPGKRLFLVLVGGGVVGDVGGLVAGLYRRGIPYLQVPTTLLAQVDSSIGGKTAVDLPQGKNLAGLFYQPRLVFIELEFLRTLPARIFCSGLAEAAKCGVIRDPALFAFLEETSVLELRESQEKLGWLVSRAVQVKASVVEADERETLGIRTALNFGHTFGHALEAATHYAGTVTHGEAVAVGMRVAAEIARRLRMIGSSDADRIRRLLEHLGLPTTVHGVPLSRILQAMSHDKKWSAGRSWVLPTRIGRVAVVRGVAQRLVRAAVQTVLEE
ncbi:MAG: 3-dehydroquinate synthase [Candidatus Omnitrophica bacterium]|nr:3-dehydroquinate synthase [Candidatus Omnitrophota bacterium]